MKLGFSLCRSASVLSLADQIVVSAARFLTTLIVGRYCGPEGLGIFVLINALLIMAAVTQESLVFSPFVVYSRSMRGRRLRVYTGSILMHWLFLSLLCASLFAIAAVVLRFSSWEQSPYISLISLLAVVTPGALLWEFSRRHALASLRMDRALAIDISFAVIQLGLLVYWGWTEQLTVLIALSVIGLSTTAVGMFYAWQLSKRVLVFPAWVRRDLQKNTRFGRWIFFGQAFGWVQAYSIPWFLTLYAGERATGIMMACHTLVLLLNPLQLGISNWLGPTLAKANATAGSSAVRRITLKAMALLTIGSVLFWFFLLVFGEWFLSLAFGPQYQGHGHLLGILGISAIGFSITVAAVNGLAALDRPNFVFRGTLWGTIVTIGSFFPLVIFLEITGGAIALSVGSLVTAIIHVVMFLRLTQNMNTPQNHQQP